MAAGRESSGVPTVADRIAQTVVALRLEARTESIFHPDSYGYRPRKSAHDALRKCRERCWRKDWVLDLDIRKFFDSLDHDLVVKTVEANTADKWVLLYVKRWLKAPLQLPDGTLQERDKGTPQGSAVSPVLANLFLHYAFDMFLEREFPTVEFERYADDAVVHCVTERQARQVREALTARLAELGLELHPGKTKIVYCKDSMRRGEHETVTFTFLGYAFRPRQVMGKNGKIFTSFTPAISPEALKAKSQVVRGWRMHMRTGTSLDELAEAINPIVAGWINYYGLFGRQDAESAPPPRQHLPDAVGSQKVQTAACLQTVPQAGGPGSSIESPACSSTGNGRARSTGMDEKSGMTGDCHVPFRGSPGVRFPRATRQVSLKK